MISVLDPTTRSTARSSIATDVGGTGKKIYNKFDVKVYCDLNENTVVSRLTILIIMKAPTYCCKLTFGFIMFELLD